MARESSFWQRTRSGRLSRRSLVRGTALGAAGLAGAALIGCGGDDDETTGGGGGATTTPGGAGGGAQATATQGAAAQPVRGGTYFTYNNADATHLDPTFSTDYTSLWPTNLTYSGLQRLAEREGPGKFNIEPDLAELEQVDDVTYVFHLKPGVRFHDLPPVNGRELVAEDVAFTWERGRDSSEVGGKQKVIYLVDTVEAVDASTVRFTLPAPLAAFSTFTALGWAKIVAPEAVEEFGDLRNQAIGTGPYVLRDWRKGEALEFDRHPSYFDEGFPYMDRVDYRIIPESETSLAAFRTGQIDGRSVSKRDVDSVKKSNPDAQWYETPAGSQFQFVLNTSREPFGDIRVRQAIYAATDWAEYSALISDGDGHQNGPIQWWHGDFALPQEELPQQDLQKAKQLIDAAGYGDGSLVIDGLCSQVLDGDQIFQITREQMKQIGIDWQVNVGEWGQVLKRLIGNDFQAAAYVDWVFEDPDQYLYPYHSSIRGRNFPENLLDEEVQAKLDGLLEQQRAAFDVGARREALAEVQRLLMEQAPNIWLYTSITRTAVQPWLHGYQALASTPSGHRFDFELWKDKDAN